MTIIRLIIPVLSHGFIRPFRLISFGALVCALLVTLSPIPVGATSFIVAQSAAEPVIDAALSWDAVTPALPYHGPNDWLFESGQRTAVQAYGPLSNGKTYKVGDTEKFFALNFDSTSDTPQTISATLKLITAHAYWWFEAGTTADPKALIQAGDRFEQSIYPLDMKLFSGLQSHGIDVDPHIFILHQKTLGQEVVGLFSDRDECPRAICSDSNQHDMLYIRLDYGPVGSENEMATVAHELQHLIRYHAGNQDRWLDEGLAQLAEHLNGFNPDEIVGTSLSDFLHASRVQLDTWPTDPNADPGLNYTVGYMFSVYLYQRFGVQIIQAISQSPYKGMAAIDHALKDIHASETIDQVFVDWTIANAVNNPYAGDGRYYYQSIHLPDVPEAEKLPTIGRWHNTLPEYSADYLQLSTPGVYTLTFSGLSHYPLLPPDPLGKAWMWWSYDLPEGLTRLEHSFDLRHTQKPVLTYSAWWNIDNADGDRAYVLVSTDNGATWQSVKPSGSSPCRAEKACYFGNSDSWRSEKIDLSKFAGQQVRLRFEMITQSGGVGQGLFLTNFQLSAAGFTDNVQTGTGDWQASGFMRVVNQLPQRWVVNAILRPNQDTPQIVPMPIKPDQTGTLTVTVPPGGATIVVDAMAPFVSGSSSYTLTAHQSSTSPASK